MCRRDTTCCAKRWQAPGEGRAQVLRPEDVAACVLRTARPFLRLDDHLAGETQAITSLYLDTPSLTFLRWHLEGASERFKLRVRAYGSAPHTIVYAEVKRKWASSAASAASPFRATRSGRCSTERACRLDCQRS